MYLRHIIYHPLIYLISRINDQKKNKKKRKRVVEDLSIVIANRTEERLKETISNEREGQVLINDLPNAFP